MREFPESFLIRMKALLGEEFEDFVSALDEEPIRAFRINKNKISVEFINTKKAVLQSQFEAL